MANKMLSEVNNRSWVMLPFNKRVIKKTLDRTQLHMTDFPLYTSHRLQTEEAMKSSEKLQLFFSIYLIYKKTSGLGCVFRIQTICEAGTMLVPSKDRFILALLELSLAGSWQFLVWGRGVGVWGTAERTLRIFGTDSFGFWKITRLAL